METPARPAARTRPFHATDPFKGANPRDPAFRADPYPALARLRTHAPVDCVFGVWRLARYDDCVRLLREAPTSVRAPREAAEEGSSSEAPADVTAPAGAACDLRAEPRPAFGTALFMLHQDPPAHTRLRRLVAKAFTPRATERLRAHVQGMADALVARALDRGEMDVLADLALPIPAAVICEMMGVPGADRDRLTAWTGRLTHLLAAASAPPDVLAAALAAQEALGGYIVDLVADRRRAPREDILSDLVRAEDAGDRLSPEELVSQAIGLLSAGFETTIGLIANGARQLARHPREQARLRGQPALIAPAVEECLRFDGPVMQTMRVLRDDTRFGDVIVPAGAEVIALLAAANRDPGRFPDPDRFDIARAPNDHLAFGGGIHFCQGAHLARMEAQVALGTLASRTAVLEVDDAPLDWSRSLFRVPRRLPLRLRAR